MASRQRPRAVQEASDRADQIHAEVYPEEDAQKPEEPPEEPGGDEPTPAPVTPPQPPSAPPAAAPTPVTPKEETVDFWRNKFQTLEGKYRAEVPRLQSQLRESADRMQRLEQTIAGMAVQSPTPNGHGAPASNKLVSDEEVEEYGEDFVSMIRRVAQEEAGRAVQTVAPRIEQVQGELQKTRAQTAIDRVYAQLDDQVKDWRTINRSQEFLDWLEEEDPFAGDTRKNLLRAAFQRADGPRVLNFFTGFLNEQHTLNPPQAADPQTPPARTQPRVSLEQLAGPRGGSGGGGASASEEAPTQPWTRRQIAAFYKDVQTGVYKTDPAKRDRIEASIQKAVAAGLVTP